MYKELSVMQFRDKYLNELDKLEIIDVREPSEFSEIRIKGSKLISM